MSFCRLALVVLLSLGLAIGCSTPRPTPTPQEEDALKRERRQHREEVELLERKLATAVDEAKAESRQVGRLERELAASKATGEAHKRALDSALNRLRSSQERKAHAPQASSSLAAHEVAALLRSKDRQLKQMEAELQRIARGQHKVARPNPKLLVEVVSTDLEKPLARVGGRTFRRRDFAEFLFRDLGVPRLLDLFINRYLVEREAKRVGIEISNVDAEVWVGRQINEQLEQAGKDEAKLTRRLQEIGYTRESWEARLRHHAKPTLILVRLVALQRKTRQGKKVWQAQLRKTYRQRYSERVSAAEIFFRVPPQAPPAEVEAALRQADAAYRQLRSGIPFAKVARYHSDGESAKLGGALGVFDRRKYTALPRLNNAFFTLTEGEISQPIRSKIGFHIVRVEERLPPARRFDAQTRRMLAQELQQKPPSPRRSNFC